MVPGDPERENEVSRSKNGIPVNSSVEKDLEEISEKMELKLSFQP